MSDGRWQDWVGRTQTLEDEIDPRRAAMLAATLGRPGDGLRAGQALPPLWNWIYFLEAATKAEVGPDGHPRRGGFLPPIEHPRRMWAGSRCGFHAPILIGAPARKTSTLVSIAEKSGRAGPMVFVTVRHDIHSGGRLAVHEEQDIVYMDIPEAYRAAPGEPLPEAVKTEPVAIDPVVLFRFSALTFNGHRIHYDRPYAMDVEKYPGLVVHGPLQAILLFDYATRLHPARVAAGFSFRGMRALFDFDLASLNAREDGPGALDLFVASGEGAVTMKARLDWAA